GVLHDRLDLRLVHAGHARGQRGDDGEAYTVLAVGEAHVGTDRRLVGKRRLAAACREMHGAEEAGRIADREELLGIGARTVVAAHCLRLREPDSDLAVVGLRMSPAAAAVARRCMCGVFDLHGLFLPYDVPELSERGG